MKTLFVSGRTQLESNDWSLSSGSGSLSAGTYYFSVQAHNIVGRNLLSIKSITVTNNSSITLTVNSTALKANENWTSFIIGLSSSSVETTFKQIKELRIKEIGNPSISYNLPLVYTFTSLSQLDTEIEIDTIEELETTATNYATGQVIFLLETANYYQFVKDLYTEVDNIYVLQSNLANHKWKVIDTNYCLVSNLAGLRGCNQEVRTYTEDFEFEGIAYSGDGSLSLNIDYLLLPENIEDDKFIIDFGIFIGSLDLSNLFSRKISYLVKGVLNRDTYELRNLSNSLENLDFIDYKVWEYNKEDYEYLIDNLLINEGLLISVKVAFYLDEFLINIPDDSQLRILPYLKTDLTIFSSSNLVNYGYGLLFYSLNSDYSRVYPNDGLTLKVSSGLGVIKGVSFPVTTETTLSGFPTNTANSQLKINQSGSVYFSNTELTNTEATRAFISTEILESDIINLFTLTGNTLTITHPVDNNGFAYIREDYPDVIAGKLAKFNPTGFNLYVQNIANSEVRVFNFNSVVSSVNLVFNTGVEVNQIPVSSLVKGFYQVENIVSNIGGEQYIVGLAYTYNGNTVSAITHSPSLGCVLELPTQFSSSSDIASNLGTAAFEDIGESIGQVPILENVDGIAGLPAVDGSQLLGIDKINTEYKNANFLGETNTLYLVDTTDSPITCFLPLSVASGKRISFSDYAGTDYRNPTGFGKNSLILDSQGQGIEEENTLEIDIELGNVTVIFINNTWKVYTDFNPTRTTLTIDNSGSSGGFTGDYDDLTNKPTLFSGDYPDLTNKPTLFSGSWEDLTDKYIKFVTLSANKTFQLSDHNTWFLIDASLTLTFPVLTENIEVITRITASSVVLTLSATSPAVLSPVLASITTEVDKTYHFIFNTANNTWYITGN